MRDTHRNLRSHRHSRFYIPEAVENDPNLANYLQRGQLRWSSFYGHMLAEDTAQILPWRNDPSSGFSVSLDPHSSEIENLVTDALISPTGPSSNLETGVRYHLSWIAHMLLRGPAVYEIDFLSGPDDKTVAFRTGAIPPRSIDKLRGRYIQYVPEELGEGRKHHGRFYIPLDADTLIGIRFRRRMHTTIRQVAATLALADAQQVTPTTMLRAQVRDFDLNEFNNRRAREILCATRDLGWSARWAFNDQMTSPYIVWRHLQFQQFKISIRDACIAGLNRTLAIAGAAIGFKAKIVLHGAITKDDLDQARRDLQTGSRPLTELLRMQA
jgi:hypothetical protein